MDLDFTEAIGPISGSGEISISSGKTLSVGVDAGTSTSFDGVIRGGGDFTKQGSGTLILSGANSELGNSRVEDGKIVVSNQNALGSGKVVAVDDGATLAIQSSQQHRANFANQINLGSAGPSRRRELASGSVQILSPFISSIIHLFACNPMMFFLDDTDQPLAPT